MEKLTKPIKENWLIIGFFIGIVLWYSNTNSRLDAAESKIVQQQAALEKLDVLIIDVAVMQTDVSFIKQRLK